MEARADNPSAAEILRQARPASGLSQSELSRRVGVAQSVISAYEGGHREPSLVALRRLVSATGQRLAIRVEPVDPGLRDQDATK